MCLVFSLLSVGSLLICYFGLGAIDEMNKSLLFIVNGPAKRVSLAHELQETLYLQFYNERNLILEETKEGIESIDKLMHKRNDQVSDILKKYESIADEAGKKNLKDFEATYALWWDNSRKTLAEAHQNNDKGAYLISQKGLDFRKKAEDIIEQMTDRNKQKMVSETEKAEALFTNSRWTMILLSVGVILVGGVVAGVALYFVGKSIRHVIETLTGSSEQVSRS